jgi:CheY-like chemotaxis protein
MNASSSLRLLVVEHQARLRQLVRRWVEGLDSVVCECASLDEAMRLGAEWRPDWVLVDAQLQPVNGLLALPRLKLLLADAQFVLVSDYDDDALRAAACQAGAGHFLLKEELSELRPLLAPRRGPE